MNFIAQYGIIYSNASIGRYTTIRGGNDKSESAPAQLGCAGSCTVYGDSYDRHAKARQSAPILIPDTFV